MGRGALWAKGELCEYNGSGVQNRNCLSAERQRSRGLEHSISQGFDGCVACRNPEVPPDVLVRLTALAAPPFRRGCDT